MAPIEQDLPYRSRLSLRYVVMAASVERLMVRDRQALPLQFTSSAALEPFTRHAMTYNVSSLLIILTIYKRNPGV